MSNFSSLETSSNARRLFGLVSIALFVDMLLYGGIVPLLPDYLSELGILESELGLLFGSYAIALLATTPFMGKLCQWVSLRAVFVIGLCVLSLSTLLFATVNSYLLLCIARSLQGMAAAVIWTSGLTGLVCVFPVHRRGSVLGMATTISAFGTLLGPSLSGFLAEHLGKSALFFVLTLVSAVLVAVASCPLFMGLEVSVVVKSNSTFNIFADKTVRQICMVIILGSSLLGLLESMLPLHLSTQLASTPSIIGFLFMTCTISYALSAPVAGYFADTLGAIRVITCGWLIAIVVLPTLALPDTLLKEAGLMIVLGLAMAALLSPTLQALAVAADHQKQEYVVVYAAYNFAFALGLLIGSLGGGLLVELFNTQMMLKLSSLSLAILGSFPIRRLLNNSGS